MDNPTNTPEDQAKWSKSPNEATFKRQAVELLGTKLGVKLNCASNRREVTDDTGEARAACMFSSSKDNTYLFWLPTNLEDQLRNNGLQNTILLVFGEPTCAYAVPFDVISEPLKQFKIQEKHKVFFVDDKSGHPQLHLHDKEKLSLEDFLIGECMVETSEGEGSSTEASEHWIFQCNPKYYDLVSCLNDDAADRWNVKQHKAKIASGDKIIIWMSGSDSGCYALGEISSGVIEEEGKASEEFVDKYTISSDAAEGWKTYVKIKISHNLADRPILKSEIAGKEMFKEFYGGRQGTNFTLTKAQYEELKRMAEARLGGKESSVIKDLQPYDNEGKLLDAKFSVDLYRPSVTLESWGARRNPDYNAALEVILERLAETSFDIFKIRLASQKAKELTDKETVYEVEKFPYPIVCREIQDFKNLRIAIGRAGLHLAQEPGATGGNPTKRIKIEFGGDGIDEFSSSREFADFLVRKPESSVEGRGEAQSPEINLSIDWLKEQTHLSEEFLNEVVESLNDPNGGQIIFAGPPGTGKTWVAKHLAKYLTQDRSSRYKIVQFHPSYGYEDFVEGLRPDVREDGTLFFEPSPGHILKLAKNAEENPNVNFVLVMDELNRANLPKVLGELLYLLEYRDEKIDLQYSTGVSLPRNLKFIGTMNTADRSIRSIDAAIRRRFRFFDLEPSADVLEAYYASEDTSFLCSGFQALNDKLADALDSHHTIGHSYFMHDSFDETVLALTWKRQVFPLLQEYFIDLKPEELEREYSIEKFWGEE